jgi:hypothetical protein
LRDFTNIRSGSAVFYVAKQQNRRPQFTATEQHPKDACANGVPSQMLPNGWGGILARL